MSKRVWLLNLLLVFFGVLVAAVGAVGHRSAPYWGLLLSLVMLFAGALAAKIYASFPGLISFAASWLVISYFFSIKMPSGSILIIDDIFGKVWLFGGAALIVVAALIPLKISPGGNSSGQG